MYATVATATKAANNDFQKCQKKPNTDKNMYATFKILLSIILYH